MEKSSSLRAFVLDDQGQDDLLKEALKNAREQGFRMKRAMDTGELNGVLKHAAEVLRELRTSLLSPKNYYHLYMQVLDELRDLESYFDDLHRSGTSIRTLYERVQSSGNVLPRLYLLVTVGSVYIKSKEAPAREILTDLVEMTKGVQYPLRGLFLRNYLSVCVKDKLPDVGSEYEGAGGSTEDAIAFLLQNLSEMNRLWIRMQHQKAGQQAAKDKVTREKERQDLRLLVGSSLVRLSQMEGVTATVYANQVLPKLLETVVACKDKIAQQYLMDCIIQVFPDEYHLQNLEKLLGALSELHEAVDSPAILVTLLERLLKYRESSNDSRALSLANGNGDVDSAQKGDEMFQLILTCVTKLSMSPSPEQQTSVLPLFVMFITFTLKCFDAKTELLRRAMNCCLTSLHEQQQKMAADKASLAKRDHVTNHVKQLQVVLIEALTIPQLMEIECWSELTKFLPWKTRKLVVLDFVQILTKRKERIDELREVEFLLEVLTPLTRDDPNEPTTDPTAAGIREEFEREQTTVSKVIHLLDSDDLDVKFQMFSVTRRSFGQGGVFRIRFTLVPLVFQSLALARALEKRKTDFKTTPREVLQFVHEIVTALASKVDQMSVSSVNLFLECALAADSCGFEAIAYEFITQAFIVYEDQITNSREEWKALELMVLSLCACTSLSAANYEVLATKTTQYAAKLLKKQEQGAMVLNCAHLFWHRNLRDGKRVLECLQRSLRIADSCSSSSSGQVSLFLEILEAYLYFFEQKVPEVTQQYLHGLVALVKEHLENMEHGQPRNEGEMRYRLILRHMESKAIAVSQSSLDG
ncbi:TPA: hypothetical protein N0F65_011292 [Lagenidium giganteum]|uniref:Vacuolar protein sorting-associated protein 35 n=1 Tax=Lagenidium giganteum TaxID=4803 RepID=A0AAV2YVI0_9STRA|nr:TPA: hypothetical protein N0F65_011292 [Lagenidium giganteum]